MTKLVRVGVLGCGNVGSAFVNLVLAQQAQVIAQDVAATTGTNVEHWWQRLRDTLRTTDDPEARAFLD